jgi:hypothetical protein
MGDEPELSIMFSATGRDCVGIITAKYGETGIHTENQFPIADAKRRGEIVSFICEKYPGLKPDDIRQKLEDLAAKAAENEAKATREKPTQSDNLLKLAESAELFTDNEIEYATVRIELPNIHCETYAIRNKKFRLWLSNAYVQQAGRAASSAAMQDAVDTLCGKAANSGITRKVGVRIGEFDGKIYMDLANGVGQAVEISSTSWQIISDPPIRFLRKLGMQEIPAPIPGGKPDELRPLLNIPNDETWHLVVAWLVGAMNFKGPYPILVVNGEQGSAKSTFCRIIKRLIDPNKADLRSLPRNEHELFIAASNSWILIFDNLSIIRPEMSDSICRISTGGGFSARELYSDESEKLFNVCRPQILNGIEEIATRGDLLERAIAIQLRTIPDENRMPESEIWKKFDEMRPRILGALCDAISGALRSRDNIKLTKLPRLADFAVWVSAAESAMAWNPGTFLAAFENNRKSANGAALDASPLAQLLINFMEARQDFAGSATELMNELQTGELAEPKLWDRRGLPKTPRKLSDELRQIVPSLRGVGISAILGERQGRNRKRIIRIERAAKSASAPSTSVRNGDSVAQSGIVADGDTFLSSAFCPQTVAENTETDDADGADDMNLAQSAYAEGR